MEYFREALKQSVKEVNAILTRENNKTTDIRAKRPGTDHTIHLVYSPLDAEKSGRGYYWQDLVTYQVSKRLYKSVGSAWSAMCHETLQWEES